MKKRHLPLTIALAIFTTLSAFAQYDRDTVYMQAGQTNDVYYSMLNGDVQNIARNAWDIEFYTDAFSDGIRTNDYDGVELYTYPNGDTASWNTLDTAGISSWGLMYNSSDVWDEGAFSQNALGHPDYGWGIYNMTTHVIHGDSLFVIKTSNGDFKKLRLEKKVATANTHYFTFANIDGTNEQSVILDCSTYDTKLFVAYNLTTNTIYDRDPLAEAWDLKFTKYMALIPGFGGYPLQGVLSNNDVQIAKYEPVDTASNMWSTYDLDSNSISAMGYSFKSMGVIKDSTTYFISDVSGEIWKLVFESYSTPEGKIGLRKQLISATGINPIDVKNFNVSEVFPNPSHRLANVVVKLSEESSIMTQILDLSGKVVKTNNHGNLQGLNTLNIDLSSLNSGIYILQISTQQQTHSQKLIIE